MNPARVRRSAKGPSPTLSRCGRSAGRSVALASFLTALLVLGSGCAASGERDLASSRPQSQPRATKTLTVGLQQEPAIMSWELAQTNVKSGGAHLVFNMLHNYLVVQDDAKGYRAQLAVEKPSVENGGWRLNGDGSMDLTWRIRPGVAWHDGTPFTSEDLAFSFEVYKDPEMPNNIGRIIRTMESVAAPDPSTLVVHWAETFVDADQGPGLQPLPAHLLRQTYATDRANFARSPRLSTEFVGLGPYKIGRWESGSHLELVPFETYFMGRPPLDSVVVRFIPDATTLVANVLSGSVDILPPIGIDIDATLEVKRRWEGTDNLALPQLRGGFRVLEIQQRAEYARPLNGLPSLPVRQGLYHAIDRPALANTMGAGISPVADSWLGPTDELRPQLEARIPQFPYDPAHGLALLAQAGWARGPDGALMHTQTGERFAVQLTARGVKDSKEQSIIADNWKALGAQVDLYDIPPALQADREHTSTLSGAWLATLQPEHLTTDRFHSRSITSAATRWTGNNRGGYSNPKVDALLDKLTVTIPQAERLALYGDLLREEMGDLPLMMLYWEGDIMLAAGGVRGTRGGSNSTFNFFEWTKD